MRGPARRITERKLIFVEGPRDREFFEAFLRHLHLGDVQVLPMGGKDHLKGELRVLVRGPAFDRVESLLIVRDADESEAAAFSAVQAALAQTSNGGGLQPLAVPDRPLVYTGGRPKVGVVIMPGGGRSGALEELLIAAAKEDPVMPLATDYISRANEVLGQAEHHRDGPPPHRLAKAQIHAFLATFYDPTRHVGHAAIAGVWDFDHPAFKQLRQVLLDL